MTENRVLYGDCRDSMRQLAADGVRVQMCVTSPPYYGLRSYLPDGVVLKDGLPPDVVAEILEELQAAGVFPLDHTSE
jgi:DNA modification methylase